jgi:hypothetical protein
VLALTCPAAPKSLPSRWLWRAASGVVRDQMLGGLGKWKVIALRVGVRERGKNIWGTGALGQWKELTLEICFSTVLCIFGE